MEKEYLPSDYLPIVIQFAAAVGFVAFSNLLSFNVGPKRHSKVKDANWESGIQAVGDARAPISIKYFLIAILFVLFDVEIIFMYPWAVNFRQLGVNGLIEMVFFMGIVLVGFYYILKKGVLKWE